MRQPTIFLISALLAFSTVIFAQEKKPDFRKLHYLSQEEMDMDFDASKNFYETDPPEGNIRNVAEFDQMQAVLVRYPFGVPIELIREMAEDNEVLTIVANNSQENNVLDIYEDNSVNLDNCSFLHAPTDSYWVRDYGPWFVFDGNKQPGIMNFPYNRPRPNDNDIPIRVSEYLNIDLYGMNLLQTGGNYMSDGMGISSSTDLVWEENDDLSPEDIDTLVFDYLNIEQYDVRPDPLDDYIKHIDCWGKYLSPGKVIIGQVPESDYRYQDFEDAAIFYAGKISSYGKPYEVVRVYTPGTYPYTPYTNSLILNKKVFVPITGSQWDDEALEVYEEAMPGYEIIGIMHDGWYNTDALHCRTKGIADLDMLYIKHVPTLATVGLQESYEITAEITANSGTYLLADSVLIYYSINGGEFMTTTMVNDSLDYWSGSITGAEAGDEIDYYLYAVDQIGKSAYHPYIGMPDPHEFNVFGIQTDDLVLDPDTLLFLTPESLAGLALDITNTTNDTIEILDITEMNEEYGFTWWAESLPEFPYLLLPNETLTVWVQIAVPVSNPDVILQDSIFVSTENKIYFSLLLFDSDLVGVEENMPANSSLQVFPNPFSTRVYFSQKLTKQDEIYLNIYDSKGRLIWQSSGFYSAGINQLVWDGKNEQGHLLPNGYYIYELQAGNTVQNGKVVLMR